MDYLKNLERADFMLNQAIETAALYNNPDYLRTTDQEREITDVDNGANFIREALKQGLSKAKIKIKLAPHRKSFSSEANAILDFIVYDGYKEFKKFNQ